MTLFHSCKPQPKRAARAAATLLVTALSLSASSASARLGDWGDPIIVNELPFTHAGDTRGRASRVNSYSCAPSLSEQGPEVLYRLQIPRAGRLRAWVEGDDGAVDIDVHILTQMSESAGLAQGCAARDNRVASAGLGAGTAYVSVDSYAGAQQAGPYRLHLDFQPDGDWRHKPLARGVTLETKEYSSLFGGKQTGSVVRVDLSEPGVSVRPIGGAGCATTSQLGRQAGAVAAINAGFFSLNASCSSVSLLKSQGQLISRNAVGRSAFGLSAAGAPLMDWVSAGADWPAAHSAVGGLSRLVSAGAVNVEWERDGASSSFTYGANPRSAVGYRGQTVTLATLDGRTSAGLGVDLFDLAQWLVWLDVSEGLNLDGGGSTTLWARGEPHGGVVNFPSDNGAADHSGERLVSNALGVFAPELERETEWVARHGEPSLRVGERFSVELFAIDPDGEELSLSASTSGAGALSFEPQLDGGAQLEYVPVSSDSQRVTLTVEARAAGTLDGSWRLTLNIIDSLGPPTEPEPDPEGGEAAGGAPGGPEPQGGQGASPTGGERSPTPGGGTDETGGEVAPAGMTPPSAGSSGVAPQGATEPTPEPRGGDASAGQTGSGGRPIPSPTPSPEAGEPPPQGFSPQPSSAQSSGGVSCASAPEQSSPLALILMLLALPSLIGRVRGIS